MLPIAWPPALVWRIEMDENSIVALVQLALRPELNNIHGRVTELAKSTSKIDERTEHMPTKDDMHGAIKSAIKSHHAGCESSRRWIWGIALGLPATLLALGTFLKTIMAIWP
jgi:hypothetical protein